MLTNRKLIIFVSSVLIFFCACKKNDPIVYPQNLKVVGFQNVKEPRLFAKQGEIKDSKIVKRFVSVYDKSGYFSASKTYDYPSDFITFVSADSVEVSLTEFPDRLAVERKDGYLFLLPKDSMTYIGDSFTDFLAIGKMKPGYKTYLIPMSSGYSKFVKARIPYICSGNEQELVFPFLNALKLVKENSSYKGSVISDINNTFDESYVKTLGVSDTLLIQEYELLFKNSQ